MAWVAILTGFACLFVALAAVAAVLILGLAFPRRDDDWTGELETGYDDRAANPEPEVDYSAAATGPQYHLVLLNDDIHTYQYVITMLRDVFGIPTPRGYALAHQIDEQGRAVVFIGSLDRVNDKRKQVLEYGPDKWATSKTVQPLAVVIEKAS
jgi:ATP-dependent Clp protease adaptor protein ClpS